MKKLFVCLIGVLLGLALCACTPDTPAVIDPLDDVTTDALQTDAPEPKVDILHFLAVGDNLLHQSILNQAYNSAASLAVGGNYDKDYYFADMYEAVADDIKSADIAFVNQEGPIAGESFGFSGHPFFNAPNEAGDTLVSLGFDVVNIANNHMLDMDGIWKGTGYQNSIDFWQSRDVMLIGGYETESDFNAPHIIEKNGIKIAMLSYTYGTNGRTQNEGSNCIVPLIEDNVIVRQISALEGKADLIFVSMHWGDENTFEPTDEQRRLAKLCADAGADAIIGHHSHTLQPIEWIEGKDGNRMLCLYSLGNFISTMQYSYNMLGGIFEFDVIKKEGEDAYIDNVVLTPTVCHYLADPDVLDAQSLPTRWGVKLYRLCDYTEALCRQNGAQLWGEFDLDTLYGYLNDTISLEFLEVQYR